jgi:hypothetical protein
VLWGSMGDPPDRDCTAVPLHMLQCPPVGPQPSAGGLVERSCGACVRACVRVCASEGPCFPASHARSREQQAAATGCCGCVCVRARVTRTCVCCLTAAAVDDRAAGRQGQTAAARLAVTNSSNLSARQALACSMLLCVSTRARAAARMPTAAVAGAACACQRRTPCVCRCAARAGCAGCACARERC